MMHEANCCMANWVVHSAIGYLYKFIKRTLGKFVTSSFELLLLDGRSEDSVIAVGRRGVDTAIEYIALDAALVPLLDFGRLLGASVSGNAQRPSQEALDEYGTKLFNFAFQGSLGRLYARLPPGRISIQIFSDHPKINEVSWEYLVPPDRTPIPHRDRSVIRVHPTCGVDLPAKRPFSEVRVLLVCADPLDQQGIGATEFLAQLNNIFSLQLPAQVKLKVVEGATRQQLINIINQERFDVFHFYGHGEVDEDGVGNLVLQDMKTRQSDRISAPDLARALSGKRIQLAILSACLTATGNYANQLNVTATALIASGIPAVIANQYPIPYKTISPFVGAVYHSLANDGDIDAAVADGRATLAVGLAGTTKYAALEWGIPVLYRLSDAQQLFSL